MKKTSFALPVLALVTLSCAAFGGCAGAPDAPEEATASVSEALGDCVCPPGVPAELAPAANQTIKSSLFAEGVQIYVCTSTGTSFAWSFVAPQANLFNDEGRMVGTHFIGPTWQGNDGSSVVAAKVAGATVDASAIPWLLLGAVSHGDLEGRFSDVTSLQRLSTVGGLAPATGCDGAHVGAIAQVPYTAQYVFYKTKKHGNVQQCPAK